MGEERQDALRLGHPGRDLLLRPKPDVLREQLPAAGLLLLPFRSLFSTEQVPRAETGNLRRRLNQQSKASPSRFSGREEEEEQDGSGRRDEEEEGAEEKGGEGGGRRKLLRSGMAGREKIRVRASLEREEGMRPHLGFRGGRKRRSRTDREEKLKKRRGLRRREGKGEGGGDC